MSRWNKRRYTMWDLIVQFYVSGFRDIVGLAPFTLSFEFTLLNEDQQVPSIEALHVA